MHLKTPLTAALFVLATAVHAEPLIDQSTVPIAGQINGAMDADAVYPPVAYGQSFTAGLSGQLTKVELGLFRSDASQPVGGLTFAVQTSSGSDLFTQHIAFSAAPAFVDGLSDWSRLFTLDLSAANVRVAAGQGYRIKLTADPGSASPGLTWFKHFEDSYAGGDRVIFTGGGAQPSGQDFTFRTWVDTRPATPPAPAPEPSAWALMILGFGGAGVLLRRRSTVLP